MHASFDGPEEAHYPKVSINYLCQSPRFAPQKFCPSWTAYSYDRSAVRSLSMAAAMMGPEQLELLLGQLLQPDTV